jgi:hypothetical protein
VSKEPGAVHYVQQQEPSIEKHVDHLTKILSLHNSSFIPVSVRLYAVEFGINLIADAQNHVSIKKDEPIKSLSTHGELVSETVWPFATMTWDLTKFTQLQFEIWTGQEPDLTVYCIALDEKIWLGKTAMDALFTPKVKFFASFFGPLSQNASFGGGYSKALFDVEKQIKADCLLILEKTR